MLTSFSASDDKKRSVNDSEVVADASALLAYFQNEPGAEVVERAFEGLVHVGAVNWAEVLSKIAETGQSLAGFRSQLESRGVLGPLLRVVPLDEVTAQEIGQLRPATRPHGLSLGDRACLALGRRLDLPVLTADRNWREVSLDAPEIHLIR